MNEADFVSVFYPQAAGGERLPEVEMLQKRYGAVTPEIQDTVVHHSLTLALDRVRAIAPAFIGAIEAAALDVR